MHRRKIILTITLILLLSIAFIHAKSAELNESNEVTRYTETITPTSNFFTQVNNQTLVDIPVDTSELTNLGYQLVTENNQIALYLEEKTLGIAILDKDTGYIWYSVYKDYKRYIPNGKSRQFIESGVTIEYYDSDSLNEITEYVSNPQAKVEKTYTFTDHGFKVHLDFTKAGISFDVEVKIDGKDLHAAVLHDSIVEIPYQSPAMKNPKEFKLKSVTIFPYLGSQNFEINGYSFIPDGSGALVRYTNIPSDTAYIKRVYGGDNGLQSLQTIYEHLKPEAEVSMPIFGVSHGYNQAAFLAEIISGNGAAEIHSYPYKYNNVPFNTTFAKDIIRDKYVVRMSTSDTSGIPIITELPYPKDFEIRYSFLSNNHANYLGMAKKYRENFELKQLEKQEDINLRLELIGMDYKPGLFGKDYVAMTTYEDVVDIVNDLGINELELVYMGWNKGGYYDNTPVIPKTSNKLGGTDDFNNMKEILDQKGIDLYLYDNPLIAFDTINRDIVKRLNFSLATSSTKSTLFDQVYYRPYEKVADSITNNSRDYEILNIDALAIDRVGKNLYSYLYNSKETYRDEAIGIIQNELSELENYNIGLYQPNDYTFDYIDSYYDIYYESNKYAYITDSIPFIQLVLSGYVNMYSNRINFMSDYDLIALRLIEYNIYPTFIVTKEPTHKLRYTNFEYIYTSEYRLWKSQISDTYKKVNDALKYVQGETMVSHEYVAPGVSCVTYQNGVKIYVNYTSTDYVTSSVTVPSMGYLVKEVN